eukprot:gene18401-41528_t
MLRTCPTVCCARRLARLAALPAAGPHAARVLEQCCGRLADPHPKVACEVLACCDAVVDHHPQEALPLLERLLTGAFGLMGDRKVEVRDRARAVVDRTMARNTCFLYLLRFCGEWLAQPQKARAGQAKLLRVIASARALRTAWRDARGEGAADAAGRLPAPTHAAGEQHGAPTLTLGAEAAAVGCLVAMHGVHAGARGGMAPGGFVADAAALPALQRRALVDALREQGTECGQWTHSVSFWESWRLVRDRVPSLAADVAATAPAPPARDAPPPAAAAAPRPALRAEPRHADPQTPPSPATAAPPAATPPDHAPPRCEDGPVVPALLA